MEKNVTLGVNNFHLYKNFIIEKQELELRDMEGTLSSLTSRSYNFLMQHART